MSRPVAQKTQSTVAHSLTRVVTKRERMEVGTTVAFSQATLDAVSKLLQQRQ